jgi:hypothetical protein
MKLTEKDKVPRSGVIVLSITHPKTTWPGSNSSSGAKALAV